MDTQDVYQVGVLFAVALFWLLLNLLAGYTWLKFVSLCAMLGFFAAGSWVAVDTIFGIV